MKRILSIGLIVCLLALSGIGAAFATGMNFSSVGALSLGVKNIPQINTDYVGYHLTSALGDAVVVDGVYISLDTDISGTNAVSVSLRAADGTELAAYAANDVVWNAADITLVDMLYYTDLPTPDQVFKVKVVVAQNSEYN